ncbi:MAG TPA: dienelactone hydrolase family protein [Candidatus Saccharibacteria bacterium]|nr:dienelactone hydrolase family protein [Candidatus Saccharibacteria bacterium]HMT39887.1 dienelactone hydrolase family protein [Candidatus Saccharibacteria bacterium]
MNLDYLYESNKNSNTSSTAVIVLPEIFGLTDFITSITDKFAEQFGVSAYALDFFYQLNHTANKFNYETDMQKGIELMQQMKGEDFLSIFNNAIEKIISTYPNITSFTVCGFCFGGRLAYLSGLNDKVEKIISFYGAGANQPNYINGNSCIGALSAKRSNDSKLSILSLYGGRDDSIPVEDRDKTKDSLVKSGIDYQEVVYEQTGHAFFNNHRPQVYNASAATDAWNKVAEYINDSNDKR